jgi:hypothetical protein
VLACVALASSCGGSGKKTSGTATNSSARGSGATTARASSGGAPAGGVLGTFRRCLHEQGDTAAAQQRCARSLKGTTSSPKLTLDKALERAAVEKLAACIREQEHATTPALARARCDRVVASRLNGR